MNRTQKREKVKKVRETYLKFRDRNLIPKRKAEKARKIAEAKLRKEEQDAFTRILNLN
jgi:hypothetical protein